MTRNDPSSEERPASASSPNYPERIGVPITEEMKQEIVDESCRRSKEANGRVSMSDIVREAIREYFEEPTSTANQPPGGKESGGGFSELPSAPRQLPADAAGSGGSPPDPEA